MWRNRRLLVVKVPPLRASLLARLPQGERVPQWHYPFRDAMGCERRPVFTVIANGTPASTGDSLLIAAMARALHRRAA